MCSCMFETKHMLQEQDLISRMGHRIYFLHDAGHWVHTDNPKGLYSIMAPSFGIPDIQTRIGQMAQPALT